MRINPENTGIRRTPAGWAAVRNGVTVLTTTGTGSKARAIRTVGTNRRVECEHVLEITWEEIDAEDFPTSDLDHCAQCGQQIVEADYGARIWYHVIEPIAA